MPELQSDDLPGVRVGEPNKRESIIAGTSVLICTVFLCVILAFLYAENMLRFWPQAVVGAWITIEIFYCCFKPNNPVAAALVGIGIYALIAYALAVRGFWW